MAVEGLSCSYLGGVSKTKFDGMQAGLLVLCVSQAYRRQEDFNTEGTELGAQSSRRGQAKGNEENLEQSSGTPHVWRRIFTLKRLKRTKE